MRLGIEDVVVKRDDIRCGEYEVEVFQRLGHPERLQPVSDARSFCSTTQSENFSRLR